MALVFSCVDEQSFPDVASMPFYLYQSVILFIYIYTHTHRNHHVQSMPHTTVVYAYVGKTIPNGLKFLQSMDVISTISTIPNASPISTNRNMADFISTNYRNIAPSPVFLIWTSVIGCHSIETWLVFQPSKHWGLLLDLQPAGSSCSWHQKLGGCGKFTWLLKIVI